MQSKAKDIAGLTINLVKAGLVAGTTSTYTTTVTTEQVINGKFGTTLAAQTNTASPTTDAATGDAFVPVLADKATVLVWGVNAAGAIQLAQGTIVDTEPGVTTTVGAFTAILPDFPALPDDFCPIGYQLVRVSPTGATFTAGTTSWAASGITCSTIQNVATLPDRPQAS
jgi:hypothetical protein